MVIVLKIVPFAVWMLLITMTHSQKTDTSPSANVTTLYPVTNKTNNRNETEERKATLTGTAKNHAQSWKIESTFTESNLTEVEVNNTTDSKEEKILTDWVGEKEPKDFKGNNETEKKVFKDFKPSQHLGSFFDDDNAEVIKTPMSVPVFKKPPSSFASSYKGKYPSSFNKIPKQFYHTHQPFPYKFEQSIYTKTKDWPDSTRTKHSEDWSDAIDSKPTVESLVKVPAGGLYQSPDPFKETPLIDEEYGLEVTEDGKEHMIKKRVNPWQNLLRLVTAFIPVGLIISALTPSLITIHNVDDSQTTTLPYRRSDGISNLSPISERCRRRLLCELHSDRHYLPSSSSPRHKKHCYKIHCEDTEALWKMLRWMFTYNQGGNHHHPADRGGDLT